MSSLKQTSSPGEVLDAIPAGVIQLDSARRIVFANSAAAALVGATPDRLNGQNVERFLNVRIGENLAVGREQRTEVWFENTHGEVHIGVTIKAYRSASGEPSYVMLFRALARDGVPDETNMPHLERLAAIGQMVAGFAHEVRNPLAALKTLVEDLDAETPMEDPRREHVKRIRNAVQRIEKLMRKSLEFGRPQQPAARRHRPADIVLSAIEMIQPRLQQMAVDSGVIQTELAESVPDVRVDDGQIGQVLVILLNNALDATSDPSKVAVRLTRKEVKDSMAAANVLIEVEDWGPGIPPDRLGQVFNAFFTTKDTGTGLGLSIALKLVRDNQGQLTVRSTVGKGTLFALELPGMEP